VEDVADVVVIGGGIVGCSIAFEVAGRHPDRSVFLLERGPYLGDGTSTRNSYVLHAGIYYPEDSLKARFCVAGNRALAEFCKRYRIAWQRTGKLVFARMPAEIPVLEALWRQAQRNGVEGTEILEAKEMTAKEPHIRGVAALFVPSTAVFDVAQWFRVMEALLYDRAVAVLKRTPVVGLDRKGEFVEVATRNRGCVLARSVVNAAGLHADEVANWLGNAYRIYPVRGDYFSLTDRVSFLVGRAVYPCPGSLGLGIHLTRLWDGTVLVGPDARYVQSKEDYRPPDVLSPDGDLDTSSQDFLKFFRPVKEFFPVVEAKDFRLAHCGIRPCLRAPGEEGFRDFRIEPDPNVPQVIHLLGIDSPGLTASPEIAKHVAQRIDEVLSG